MRGAQEALALVGIGRVMPRVRLSKRTRAKLKALKRDLITLAALRWRRRRRERLTRARLDRGRGGQEHVGNGGGCPAAIAFGRAGPSGATRTTARVPGESLAQLSVSSALADSPKALTSDTDRSR